MTRSTLVFALTAALATPVWADETSEVTLEFSPKGAFEKTQFLRPLGIELKDAQPEEVKKLPADLKAPKFALVKMGDFTMLGNAGQPLHKPAGGLVGGGSSFLIVLDEPADQPSRLLVDTNRDGDLTNDPAPDWTVREEMNPDGTKLKTYMGSAPLDWGTADKPRIGHLGFFRFDPKDMRRSLFSKWLVAYRDYYASGKASFGNEKYDVLLSDDRVTGDYRGMALEKPEAAPADGEDPFPSGVTLLIDVNGNGRIDYKGEAYDVRQPFNIGGTTYELSDISADGSSLKVVKSTQTRPEIKPPPDHVVGKKITSFEATLMDGKKVRFPQDYKGKLVMIDFWATWCMPCMREVPNVVAAHEKFHDKGFEVLGISLDRKDAAEQVKTVTAAQKMTWPQVFDGNAWQSPLVQSYDVQGIPACWLVDGDTGVIVADESSLRGPQLSATVESALKKTGRVP